MTVDDISTSFSVLTYEVRGMERGSLAYAKSYRRVDEVRTESAPCSDATEDRCDLVQQFSVVGTAVLLFGEHGVTAYCGESKTGSSRFRTTSANICRTKLSASRSDKSSNGRNNSARSKPSVADQRHALKRETGVRDGNRDVAAEASRMVFGAACRR